MLLQAPPRPPARYTAAPIVIPVVTQPRRLTPAALRTAAGRHTVAESQQKGRRRWGSIVPGTFPRSR